MGDTHTYSVTSNTTGLDLKKMIDERFNGEIETTFWCIRFIYPKVGIIKDYDTVWGKINVGTEKGTPPVIYGSLMCLAGISAAASDEEGCEGGHLDYQEFWIRKYMNNTFKGVARGSRVASATPISVTSVTTQCVTKITARAKLRLRFPNRTRLFFPVIHICGKSPTHIPTTIAAVHVAVDNGADGIFLIPAFAYDSTEDGLADSTVDDTLAAVRQEFGNDLFVGLNYFVGDTKSFVDRVPGNTVDALWHDYGVGRSVEDDCAYDESLQAAALASVENSWTGFLFAGFFFKGKDHSLLEDEASMKQSESPAVTYGEETCRLVQEAARGLESRVEKAAFHLVFNASGPGTSRPIEAPRPLCFRTEIGVEGVMSVASGVDASNVTEVLPHIDVYLVASGIEQVSTDAAMVEFYKEAKMGLPVNLGYLDPVKVRELADLIHGFDACT